MSGEIAKSFESCDLGAYRDIHGVPTIGWGHTGKDVYIGMPAWTQEHADDTFSHDWLAAGALLTLYSPDLTDGPLEALTDFVFNLGVGNYRTSTLCQLVNAQNWPLVKPELLKWDHSGGVVIAGLLRRRQAEAALI